MGLFTSSGCDHDDMVGPFVGRSAEDMDDLIELGCDTDDDNAVFVEATSSAFEVTVYESSTECSGEEEDSVTLTFGECEQFGEGYAIIYYASGSMIMASLSVIGAFIGMIIIG
mmetsp:Transcript_31510/g.28701  ORF Transcript_31510/g.28701 Transcript_31510/m.28701 type:complete len:113 (+) Transcript_31510:364-702(+)